MKYSIYNNLIPLPQKRFLLYNAYHNMYIIIKQELHNVMFSIQPENLKLSYPKFYDQLIESGCLIEEGEDENSLLLNRINQVDTKDNEFHLIINPTLNCNFRCWYCYEEHVVQSKMNQTTLEKIKKFIENTIEHNELNSFHLSFFGGEPLLHYKDVVSSLLEYLKKTCESHKISYQASFTSNGYLITEQMVNDMKKYHVTSLQITLDGSQEFHNQVRYAYKGCDSYTKIIANVKMLLHAGISVVLRINYTQANIASAKLIANSLKEIPENEKCFLSIDFQHVWQDKENKSTILSDILEECDETFNSLHLNVITKLMDQVWNSCYADKQNQALINYNGDVYKCTARDFNSENRLGILTDNGQIEWDMNKLNKRSNLRLSKKICQECRIAPLCGGTCTQRILDSENSTACLRGLTELEKDQIVLERFYYTIIQQA